MSTLDSKTALKKKKTSFQPPLVLAIADGFGIAPAGPGNAVRLAKMPFWRALTHHYPSTTLKAHGEAVGLFPGTAGNSEAGHINLGAGRVVLQDLVAVSRTIQDGTFFKNAAFQQAIGHVKKHKSNMHLLGLLTGKNSAHAYPQHLLALLELFRQQKVKKVYLHLFTDGRDSPPFEGYQYLKTLISRLEPRREQVATIMGRFYGMDRKKDWGRTARAYHALVCGVKERSANPLRAIESAYAHGESDEFIRPTVICSQGKALPRIAANDSVIFFNARSDRARQLTKAFVQPDFNQMNPGSFKRQKHPAHLVFVALADFGPDLPGILTAYPSPDLKHTLPMELSDLRQLYVAETDKYAHMTYFFNGGYADPVGGEDRILVNSPDVVSYDESPEMSAAAITDLVATNIREDVYDFVALNFANSDMVGHTGNLTATIRGLEFIDKCFKRLVAEVVDKRNGFVIILADHGNAEEMIDVRTGKVNTEHTTNAVPFLIAGPPGVMKKIRLREGGSLADVAPTILYLLKRDKPAEMTGSTLALLREVY